MKFNPIPVRGKHLDEFTTTDKIFIGISKAQTGPFVYFLLRYALEEPNLLWMPAELSVKNVLLPLPVMFLVFDFFYTSLHWALHIKAIYGYIHKHHHTQKAPSRANEDAINVHPIEYILGEYNHLWSLFLCCHIFHIQIHILGAFLFLAIGGILAGWNHTRYDIVASLFGWTIYDSKAHDVHHRIPQSNYGQYTMFWDHVFGTYRYVVVAVCIYIWMIDFIIPDGPWLFSLSIFLSHHPTALTIQMTVSTQRLSWIPRRANLWSLWRPKRATKDSMDA